MRAVQFDHYGGPEVLRLDEVPIPEPAPGQVLVRVEATAVHPGDLIARAGGFAAVIASRDVYRLGWDFYGRVHSTGPDVDDVSLGMPVVGMTDWLRDLNGTHADFVAVPRTAVVAAPANLDPDAAAALPVNALTAAQALDLLPLMAGDTLVIVGAAGAVGGFALELAVDRGLRVLGVASPADEAFIGARGGVFLDRGLDLATQVYDQVPGGADALFDTASLSAPALAAIRDGGTYCGVIYPYAPAPARDITITTVGVHSNPHALADLVKLADVGIISPRVTARYQLDDAVQAHRHLARGGTRGDVILQT